MSWYRQRGPESARVGRRALILLAVVLYVGGAAPAALPALHQWLHDDAVRPDHFCAATVIAQGHVESPSAQPQLVPPADTTAAAPAALPLRGGRLALRLPPERAPPASLA